MPVNSVTNNLTSGATPPASQVSSRSASMDKADFLQMLTAQLRAQDPMNPVSNEDFASQLAQFSSLQELQKMSTSLDQSLQSNVLLAQTFNNTMAASLIGKTVRANSTNVTMTATGSGTISYSLPESAVDIQIDVKDSSGNIVRSLNPTAQSSGDQTVTWDGTDANGAHVPAGDYTFTVTAKNATGNSVTASTYTEGRVTEVRFENGSVLLMLGDRSIHIGDVISVRDSNGGA
jgi:flagellar basal-body rod modification protein FlgD